MYPIPRDLNLSYLVGRDVGSIGIDLCSVYLTLNAEIVSGTRRDTGVWDSVVMDSPVNFWIGGTWSLTDSSGTVLDHSMEHVERKSYQIHYLLGLKLSGYTVVSETTLALEFEKGFRFVLVDDLDGYESFTIEYGDKLIVV